jgi:hypothetical protein
MKGERVGRDASLKFQIESAQVRKATKSYPALKSAINQDKWKARGGGRAVVGSTSTQVGLCAYTGWLGEVIRYPKIK